MKLEILKLLMIVSKNACYIFLIQLISIQLMMAKTSEGQALKDIRVTIQASDLTPVQIFKKIEEQTDLKFAHSRSASILNEKLSFSFKDQSLELVLQKLARKAGLRFRRINKSISVIANESARQSRFPEVIEVFYKTISGKITDSQSGEPLAGAAVQVKGTYIGTVSDVDGNFTLSAPDDAKALIFSYVGFETLEVAIDKKTTFHISMVPDLSNLTEILVVGYGTTEKANLTGSVVNVKGDIINKRPITQASQALQGLVPGVFINTNSGEPGNDDASIVVRGIGTLNNAEPLVLIDGIEAPLNSLNPNDIESVNVLKDAASASIYGTRAANGVILITTKRGKSGKTAVTYDVYTGITSPTVLPDMVTDNRTYLETYRSAAAYSGRNNILTDELIDEYASLPSTDYLDMLVNTGSLTNHNLSISGGNESIKYYWSGGYLDQESFLEGDYYLRRFNNRLNLDLKLAKKVKIGTSLAYTKTDSRQTTKADGNVGVLGLDNPNSFNPFQGKGSFLYTNAVAANVHVVATDEFGRYGGMESRTARSSRFNPVGIRDNEWIDIDGNEFLGNAFVEFEPLEDLKLRYTTGINFQKESFLETRLEFQQYNRFGDLESTRNRGSLLRAREAASVNLTNWFQANYEKQIAKHRFKLLTGVNQETSDIKQIATYESEFGSTALVNPGNGTVNDIANYNGEWTLASVFGRFNYNYDEKYLLELNIRRDGSSRFGTEARWATFPGVSAGYIISNEPFWNVSLIDFLKIRVSWGRLGVQSADLYPFASTVILGEDYDGNSGAALSKLGNQGLQWEETTTTDIGIEVDFWEGRVALELDYFRKESEGILTGLANPLASGVTSSVVINAASIENRGWEMAWNFSEQIGRFQIKAGFNLTNVKNKVNRINPELANNEDRVQVDASGNVWWIRGEPINAIFGHQFDGIFQTNEFNEDSTLADGTDYSWIGFEPRPGDIKYTDQNGDRVIDENDMVVIGNRNPEWLYGFILDLAYAGFDFSALIQGIGESNAFISRYTGNFGHAGLRRYWLDGWTEENPSNEVPRLFVDRDGFNGRTIAGNGGMAQNSFWVVDRSYVRLKNIAIGYSLPTRLISKLPFESLRIYFSGQNLLTFTELDDLDPERVDNEEHFTSVLPHARSLIIGMNLKF